MVMFACQQFAHDILDVLNIEAREVGLTAYERYGDDRRLVNRGVNYRFWYHLGCSGRNADIFSYQGIA